MARLFKNILKHGSLYSGIGGWLLAAHWAGMENIFTCEIDKFCNKILDKHFPETDKHYDIKETNFEKYRGAVDILSTSDPCQPFSFAGKRGGTSDDRYLWPQTIRVIREVKPSYVVFENVHGFINMAFETVKSDLEAEGYTVESFIIPACAVNASHQRNRIWIIAYTKSKRREILLHNNKKSSNKSGNANSKKRITLDSYGNPFLQFEKSVGESPIFGMDDGIPNRVDRLKSLGNSIVPQIAYIIFEAIKEYDSTNTEITTSP